MTGVILSLIFAGLAASMGWQAWKRGWIYLKMGRDFMQATSTQATGRSLLFAGSLWAIGALVSVAVAAILIGLAIYYASLM